MRISLTRALQARSGPHSRYAWCPAPPVAVTRNVTPSPHSSCTLARQYARRSYAGLLCKTALCPARHNSPPASRRCGLNLWAVRGNSFNSAT